MSLLASPLESVESAVIWLLVGFSVATWALALVKVVQFVRLKHRDRRFHEQFWAASSLDAAAQPSHDLPGPAARVAQAGYAAIAVGEPGQANDLSHAINHQDRLERALRQQIVRERRSWKRAWQWSPASAAPRLSSACSALCGASWKRSKASARQARRALKPWPGDRRGAGGHRGRYRRRSACGAGLQLLPASPQADRRRPRRFRP